MIYWAPLFHFYQPPTQILSVLNRVVRESYHPLLQVLRRAPYARATLNFSGVLTEMLCEGGFSKVVQGFGELAGSGQVEFTGSAKHHAILPLIPQGEVLRQIQGNAATNRHFLGTAYQPSGFFPPELAFNQELAAPLLQTGHRWVIVSGIACPESVPWPVQVVHRVASLGRRSGEELAVFFRDDVLSNRISFQSIDAEGFVTHLLSMGQALHGDGYVVTAMDAETFGHHIPGWDQRFLAKVLQILTAHRETLVMATLSEILARCPRGQEMVPRASSWSSTQEGLAQNNPYPLWKDPANRIHQLQWQHTEISLKLIHHAMRWTESEESRKFFNIARNLQDAALHSCQYWWASRSPMWDINLVHRGLLLQREAVLNACKALRVSRASPEAKREGELLKASSDRLYQQIIEELLSA
jgi:alpha-amylase/alpha-mannosidase (GH57 family)